MKTVMDIYRNVVERLTAWVDWRIEAARMRLGA
jgi:hypothetical protein